VNSNNNNHNIAWIITIILFAWYSSGIGNALTSVIKQNFPVNIVIFVFSFILILLFTINRVLPKYFGFAWLFWAVYFIIGFLGPYTSPEIYQIIQHNGKLWIALIGLPLVVFRFRSLKCAEVLLNTCIISSCVGSLVIYGQQFGYDLLKLMPDYYQRPFGLLVNSNDAGVALSLTLIASFLYSSNYKIYINIARLVIVGAIVLTVSRGAIISVCLSTLIYFSMLSKIKTTLYLVLVITLFTVSTTYLTKYSLFDLENIEKLDALSSALSGDFTKLHRTDTRSDIWEEGLKYALTNPLTGNGHSSMEGAILGMYSPHNTFIELVGNSGLLSMLLFFLLQYYLLLKIRDISVQTMRAALISLLICFDILAFFNNSIWHLPPTAAVWALMISYIYYLPKKAITHDNKY
jgi:hypothetical protein